MVTAEVAVFEHEAQLYSAASMGPRLVTAEVTPNEAAILALDYASMGPRLVTAEVPPGQTSYSSKTLTLQWGRGWLPRKSLHL